MPTKSKATRIELFNFSTPQMRAFHMSWMAFFLCFFAWFGIAPLMKVVRAEMNLTQDQIGWCIIGSVAITILARLIIGWMCDRIGPRITYSGLLVVGALPVIGISMAHDFATFLLFRVLIGIIGASFVITSYHTSIMFAPNCVGTANATTAGWGNMGGGFTQFVMPLVFAGLVGTLGLSEAMSWRVAMVGSGTLCMLTGVAYFFLTQDSPSGNFRELRAAGLMEDKNAVSGTFWTACHDMRVWALAAIYGACFGLELTINNIASLYFADYFDEFKAMDGVKALQMAGFAAAGFGMMNLFARAVGGIVSDKFASRWGLAGRVRWLFVTLFCEGLFLMLFSQIEQLRLALVVLVLFALFVKMSNGGTYAIVPFVNKKALGSVSGIVGAGGNLGAVLAGFLFKGSLPWPTALFVLGVAVTGTAFLTFLVRFSEEAETEAAAAFETATRKLDRELELVPSNLIAAE